MDLYFLVHTFITGTFNPTSELAISIERPTNKAKTEIETQSVIIETKISKNSL